MGGRGRVVNAIGWLVNAVGPRNGPCNVRDTTSDSLFGPGSDYIVGQGVQTKNQNVAFLVFRANVRAIVSTPSSEWDPTQIPAPLIPIITNTVQRGLSNGAQTTHYLVRQLRVGAGDGVSNTSTKKGSE